MAARRGGRHRTLLHVHLLLHLHRTASMITHVYGTHPFTVSYLTWVVTRENESRHGRVGGDGARAVA
ncbi:hypothetical protein D7193_31060 [Micromonospora costi]|uniref:Uncharacterized protein n=1 Tax=Micromonospora costi TaxID=1530042 RepID=A0A3A9ZP56_9ACTN|nr:hypothetical protein D7193_31060 [Micromonospora costi]